MDSDAYEERRKRVKQAVDHCPHTLADITRAIQERVEDRTYSYAYVRGVLSGAPGKTSKYVLRAVEEELGRIDEVDVNA